VLRRVLVCAISSRIAASSTARLMLRSALNLMQYPVTLAFRLRGHVVADLRVHVHINRLFSVFRIQTIAHVLELALSSRPASRSNRSCQRRPLISAEAAGRVGDVGIDRH